MATAAAVMAAGFGAAWRASWGRWGRAPRPAHCVPATACPPPRRRQQVRTWHQSGVLCNAILPIRTLSPGRPLQATIASWMYWHCCPHARVRRVPGAPSVRRQRRPTAASRCSARPSDRAAGSWGAAGAEAGAGGWAGGAAGANGARGVVWSRWRPAKHSHLLHGVSRQQASTYGVASHVGVPFAVHAFVQNHSATRVFAPVPCSRLTLPMRYVHGAVVVMASCTVRSALAC